MFGISTRPRPTVLCASALFAVVAVASVAAGLVLHQSSPPARGRGGTGLSWVTPFPGTRVHAQVTVKSDEETCIRLTYSGAVTGSEDNCWLTKGGRAFEGAAYSTFQ